MREYCPVRESIRRTTRSADHAPMPIVPLQAADLLLPVQSRKHDHTARWFWTGFLSACALVALVGAVACRAAGY